MQPRRPAPRGNPASTVRRRRLRRATERRSSCRAWNAGLAPLPQGSRKLRARNAPGSPRAAAAVLTSRQFNAHHRCRCPSPRRLPTFRRLSTTPASGSSNLMSLFHSTGAWGTILQIATTTYATISPDSGGVPLLQGGLLASAYGKSPTFVGSSKRHRSDCLNDIFANAQDDPSTAYVAYRTLKSAEHVPPTIIPYFDSGSLAENHAHRRPD